MKLIRNRSLLLWGCVLLAALVFAAFAGRLLIVDKPQKSDVMVVLCGDTGDVRMQQAIRMMRAGYARELVLDAPDWVMYGKKLSDQAREYERTVDPDLTEHLHVCSFSINSTQGELRGITPCLRAVAPNATKALVVTSNYHTRRALSVAREVLPGYQWSASAAPDLEHFGVQWWRHREWAKTMFMEWEKTAWWWCFEKWKAH